MATYTLSTLPSRLKKDDIINVTCTKAVQSITLKKGIYKFECWGARGGSLSGTTVGGYGGYVAGTIELKADTTYYLFVGGAGTNSPYTSRDYGSVVGGAGGYNGGGTGGGGAGAGGGGCTAIGTASTMANTTSIMIASGGGGAYSSTYTANAAGRVSGTTTSVTTTYTGATGAYGRTGCYYYDTYGGGGGYYGGATISSDDANYAYGGVNYINTTLFTDRSDTAGSASVASPGSTNGYLRITVIKAGLPMFVKTDTSVVSQVTTAFVKNASGTWTELSDTDLATYFKSTGQYEVTIKTTSTPAEPPDYL